MFLDLFGVSWLSLFIMVFGINALFTTENKKNRVAKILNEGIGLNPFNRLYYKKVHTSLINLFGLIFTLCGLILLSGILSKTRNVEISSFALIVFVLVNLCLQFWMIYMLRRLKIAFENNRLKAGLLYEEVALSLSSIPILALTSVYILLVLYHILILYKCLIA